MRKYIYFIALICCALSTNINFAVFNHQLFSDSVFGECEQAGASDEAGIREVLARP